MDDQEEGLEGSRDISEEITEEEEESMSTLL